MQPATQAWGFAAVRLLGTVVIGCGAGWLFGNPFGGLAAALALHLAWVLANLARLEWWLRHRSYADPPDIGGVWGEIIAQIVRLHRRKRFHKQRFVQLMRQLQRSTAALPNGVVILNAQREIMWFNRMAARSEEHTSELQSHLKIVCRLLLEKKKKKQTMGLSLKKKKSKIQTRTR